jgi:hypothetical protein
MLSVLFLLLPLSTGNVVDPLIEERKEGVF